MPANEINRAAAGAVDFFERVLGKKVEVVSVEPMESGCWRALVEADEDTEYTRRFARPDIVGCYEVTLDSEARVLSFGRASIRERARVSGAK
jgi:hypothetical protein